MSRSWISCSTLGGTGFNVGVYLAINTVRGDIAIVWVPSGLHTIEMRLRVLTYAVNTQCTIAVIKLDPDSLFHIVFINARCERYVKSMLVRQNLLKGHPLNTPCVHNESVDISSEPNTRQVSIVGLYVVCV